MPAVRRMDVGVPLHSRLARADPQVNGLSVRGGRLSLGNGLRRHRREISHDDSTTHPQQYLVNTGPWQIPDPPPLFPWSDPTASDLLASMIPSTIWGPFIDTTLCPSSRPVATADFTPTVIASFSDSVLFALGVTRMWRQFSRDRPQDPWAQYLAMALIRHKTYVRAFTECSRNNKPMRPDHEEVYRTFRIEFGRAFVDRVDAHALRPPHPFPPTGSSTTVAASNPPWPSHSDSLIYNPVPSPPDASTIAHLAALERDLTAHAFLAWPGLWAACNANNQRLFDELATLFGMMETVISAPADSHTGREGWERSLGSLRGFLRRIFAVEWIELGSIVSLVEPRLQAMERAAGVVCEYRCYDEYDNDGDDYDDDDDNTSYRTNLTTVHIHLRRAKQDIERRSKAINLAQSYHDTIWRLGVEAKYDEFRRETRRRRRQDRERASQLERETRSERETVYGSWPRFD